MELIVVRPEGLYCPAGDFYIDPWRPVDRAVITHAHGDHARLGSARYLAAQPAARVLRTPARRHRAATTLRVRRGASRIDGVTVSLHPAGHVLGLGAGALEHRGEVWVVSGDYKLDADPTCAPFEPVRCHMFITESTFGLPIYRWAPTGRRVRRHRRLVAPQRRRGPRQRAVRLRVRQGAAHPRRASIARDRPDRRARRGRAAEPRLSRSRRRAAATRMRHRGRRQAALRRALVVAPPSAQPASPWMRRFGDYSDALRVSGWMQLRGARRRRARRPRLRAVRPRRLARPAAAIAATGAQRVIVTHG